MEQKNEIVLTPPPEALTPKQEPYREYFNTMENMFGNIPTDDRGYKDIKIYDGISNQPTVDILRIEIKYNSTKEYQDEIGVNVSRFKNERRQLNFGVDNNGELVKYPKSSEFSDYMKTAIDEIKTCSTKTGANIYVNNRLRYTSDGTKWNIPQPKESKPNLANHSNPQLQG